MHAYAVLNPLTALSHHPWHAALSALPVARIGNKKKKRKVYQKKKLFNEPGGEGGNTLEAFALRLSFAGLGPSNVRGGCLLGWYNRSQQPSQILPRKYPVLPGFVPENLRSPLLLSLAAGRERMRRAERGSKRLWEQLSPTSLRQTRKWNPSRLRAKRVLWVRRAAGSPIG